MLIDLTRCTGCNACVLACKEANALPHPAEVAQTLASDAYTCLNEYQVNSQTHYVKRQCMHCMQPACVSACTVGALRKTPEGPVVYQANRCIGCRYCQYACPFGVPTYDWDNPLGLIHKCQMCVSRLAEDKSPACVSACPNGALRFGKRAELLAQARAQIASNPGRYVDHIYGEHEAGGTSVLYLASVPFSTLGFPTLGSEPISQKAETVMNYTPLTALAVASIASALHWVTRRRRDPKGLGKPLGSSENDNLRTGGNDER
jgi:formate dehydrogenase iron-sulfur subunit